MKKSVIVIFSKNAPNEGQKFWQKFDVLIANNDLKYIAEEKELDFIDLNTLIDPGSVEDATKLVRKLSLLEDAKGRKISKIVNYNGFELWWANYDSLMYYFCLPYTQYHRLLKTLVNFSAIYLYEPNFYDLFDYFLTAYNCKYTIKINRQLKKRLPLGVFIQVILSIPFLLWIKLRRPKLMLWSSDKFDPPRDHDFRMRFIYEELRKKNIKFVEFIRSTEKFSVVIKHALKRKRPVVYSFAIVTLIRQLTIIFNNKSENTALDIFPDAKADTEQKFWFLITIHYIKNFKGDIYAIRIIKAILRFIGIKSSIIPATINRNFPEVLACKLLNIPTVGIQHGASYKNYFVSDFMHDFDGEKMLSVDKYGLWSEWWREYYIKHSKSYKSEQLYVSGPMRSFKVENQSIKEKRKEGQIKILIVSEELSVPSEVMPYFETLLFSKENFMFSFRFRPYSDGFKNWLIKNRHDILKMNNVMIAKGELQDAIRDNDVVIGSNSTAVLEALFQNKVPILFRTRKWGDFFDIKNCSDGKLFFAENQNEIVEKIKNYKSISIKNLNKLKEQYFGDHHKNGSKWVVDKSIEYI